MAVFKVIVEARAAEPPLVVSFPANGWADTYRDKPGHAVDIGLRLISEAEAAAARTEAAKVALKAHPQDGDDEARIEAYNGALMVCALGRATCQPDDVNAAFRGWMMPADTIRSAMTPAGIELLYGHLDTLTMAEAPSMPEATDAEIAEMASALLDGSAWGGMTNASAHRVKRLLSVCYDLMSAEIVSE